MLRLALGRVVGCCLSLHDLDVTSSRVSGVVSGTWRGREAGRDRRGELLHVELADIDTNSIRVHGKENFLELGAHELFLMALNRSSDAHF